jgi:hypothetical protein
MDSKLVKACDGKTAGRGGLNLNELKNSMKSQFNLTDEHFKNKTRAEIQKMCKSLMGGEVSETSQLITKVKELPKMYCDDYTLNELKNSYKQKFGKTIKLTKADRDHVCKELGYPKYKSNTSLNHARNKVIKVGEKIVNKKPLTNADKKLIIEWNATHDTLKDTLDSLANRYVSGGRLTDDELQFLDEELFKKYCRCVKKREEKGDTESLSIAGCKASVYGKTRKLKARSRPCDKELINAEITLESMKAKKPKKV